MYVGQESPDSRQGGKPQITAVTFTMTGSVAVAVEEGQFHDVTLSVPCACQPGVRMEVAVPAPHRHPHPFERRVVAHVRSDRSASSLLRAASQSRLLAWTVTHVKAFPVPVASGTVPSFTVYHSLAPTVGRPRRMSEVSFAA